MYDYIIGKVTYIKNNSIVLENNGIGYLINVSNPYSFEIGNDYKVFVYQQVKEDENSLFGFKLKEEKDLFLKLIGVKGLGCKMALPLFASSTPEGIMDAIERENIAYLKKFPKIGDKVARQIILDLKGKLVTSGNININNNANDELSEALVSLGYKPIDIKKILPSVNKNDSIEKQIKEALKLLLK